MPKSAQTIAQLCSFHMLASLCSKSFKLGFSSTWTKKFQMYKLGFKEAEEPEIKLPTFTGSWRKQGSSWKTSTSASLTMLTPLSVWITTNCGKFLKRWETRPPYPPPEKPVSQDATVRTGHGTTDWFKTGKGVWWGCMLSPCLFNLYAERITWNARLDESQAGIKLPGEILTTSDMKTIPL